MEQTTWNILLVEDDEEDYFLTRQMLLEAQRGKFTLTWASSYSAGQEALRTGTFDAVLVDFDLGARTGIDLIRETSAAGFAGPFLLLTGRGSYEVDLEAMQAGAVDYLTKGDITPAFLERSIRFAIERHRGEAELARANMALARANTELQQERARLQTLFANAPSGIILTDNAGNFLVTNPACDRIFFGGVTGNAGASAGNYTVHLTDGRPIQPDDLPLVQALRAGKTRRNVEVMLRGTSGEERIILVDAAPVRGTNGEVEGAVAVVQDITHRKRVETERERLLSENIRYQTSLEQQRALLEQQNNLLEQIIEYAPVGIALLQGEDYHYTLVNPTYQKILRGKGEILGHTLHEVLPEAEQQVAALFHEVEETAEPVSRQDAYLPMDRGNGLEDAYFTFTFSPLFDDFGAVEGIMALLIETTDQVLFQRRIEAERAWLEAVVQEMPVAVWIGDTNGKIMLYNRAALEIWGGEPQQIDTLVDYAQFNARWARSGKPMAKEDWALIRAAQGERVPPEEVEITRFDGKTTTMITSGAPIYDAAGNQLGSVAVGQDITARKELENTVRQSEQDLRRSERAIRRSEERTRQILEITYEGVWTLDEDGRTLAINERGAAILGYTISEMINRPMFDFFYIEDLDQPRILEGDQPAFANTFIGETSGYREWRVRHKDGSEVWIFTSAAPLVDEEGTDAGALIMFSDISDRKRAERESRYLNELGRALMALDAPDTIAQTTLAGLARFFDADAGMIDEVIAVPGDPSAREARKLFEYRKNETMPPAPDTPLPAMQPVLDELAALRPVVIDDVRQHPLTAGVREFEIPGLRSMVAFPHQTGGEWAGTLYLGCADARRWKPDEVNFIRAAADMAWLAIIKARYFQDLRTLGDRFRVALSQIPVTVFTLDSDLSPQWTYNARPDPSGRIAVLDAPESLALLREALASGQAVQREIQLNGGGQTAANYLLTVEPLRDADGALTGLTGAAVDVTGQRRLEARQVEFTTLMEVQRRLLEQREMERQQIARDIHDGPIQDTMGLIFALQAATSLTQDSALLATLSSLREEATKLVSELRGVCNELRPPVLARFGLERAVQAHARDFSERNPNIQLTLELAEDGPTLPEDARLALYRIYQESLNNVVRHSRATKVTVRFTLAEGSATLQVSDNGSGFKIPGDWLELARGGHLGLVGMKERAEAVGGTLHVTSQPGQGTALTVTVPWGKT